MTVIPDVNTSSDDIDEGIVIFKVLFCYILMSILTMYFKKTIWFNKESEKASSNNPNSKYLSNQAAILHSLSPYTISHQRYHQAFLDRLDNLPDTLII